MKRSTSCNKGPGFVYVKGGIGEKKKKKTFLHSVDYTQTVYKL